MSKPSICIVTEDLSKPIDEGIKHFAHSLIESWAEEYDIFSLSVRSVKEVATPHTDSIRTNKLLLSTKIRGRLSKFQPDIICYLPSASATIFSFLRCRMLKLQCFGAKIIMVSLQPRNYGWLSRMFVRILSPDMVFVQNEASMKRLVRLGCHVALLPSGVDLNKFTPVVSNDKKTEIRRKYGLDTQAFTMLHVGHITRDRNIEMLLRLKYEYKAQVILVSSSLRHKDRDMLKNLLQENGIVVIDEYLHEIQEIYQLADCYVFPVFSSSACIGVPLSVLEAMACNLSVVSVRYGNLPLIFQEGNGLIYADSPRDLIDAVSHAQNINGQCRTREKVAPYSWQKIARYVIEQIKMEK